MSKPYQLYREHQGRTHPNITMSGDRVKVGKPQPTLRAAVAEAMVQAASRNGQVYVFRDNQRVPRLEIGSWSNIGVRVQMPGAYLRLLMSGLELTDEEEQRMLNASAQIEGAVR